MTQKIARRKNYFPIILLIVCLGLFDNSSIQAQKLSSNKRYMSIGAELSNNLFKGDVFTNGQHYRPGAAVQLLYKMTPRTSVALYGGFNTLIANDGDAPQESDVFNRGYRFYSGNLTADAMLRIDLWGNEMTYIRRYKNNFYALLGTGIMKASTEYYNPSTTGKQNSKNTYGSINWGLGYVHKLNRRWSAFFEWRKRIFLTDKVDFLELDKPDQSKSLTFGIRRIMKGGGTITPKFK